MNFWLQEVEAVNPFKSWFQNYNYKMEKILIISEQFYLSKTAPVSFCCGSVLQKISAKALLFEAEKKNLKLQVASCGFHL